MKNLKQYENWAKTGKINGIKISNIFSVYEILGITPNEIMNHQLSKKLNK